MISGKKQCLPVYFVKPRLRDKRQVFPPRGSQLFPLINLPSYLAALQFSTFLTSKLENCMTPTKDHRKNYWKYSHLFGDPSGTKFALRITERSNPDAWTSTEIILWVRRIAAHHIIDRYPKHPPSHPVGASHRRDPP